MFLAAATIASALAEVARSRTAEAERRRQEADLAAEMSQILLGGTDLRRALPAAADRLAARVNGVSTPIFGVSWTPPTVDVDVARRVVAFVEIRHVLFSTYSNEVPEECVNSVLDIRNFLSDVIGAGGIRDELVEPLRLMRRYGVRFLERVARPRIAVTRTPAAGISSVSADGRCTTTGSVRPSASCAQAWVCRSASSRRPSGSTSMTRSRRRCRRPTVRRLTPCRRRSRSGTDARAAETGMRATAFAIATVGDHRPSSRAPSDGKDPRTSTPRRDQRLPALAANRYKLRRVLVP